MSAQLSSAALLALRPTAEAPVRLATEGLSSPGSVAGQFAALLATMRDGSAESATASQTGTQQAGGLSMGGQAAAGAAAGAGEHRVASAAVSLLMQDLNETPAASAGEALTPSARRRQAPADVSNQVVEGTVNNGAPISAPWMATLMAAGMSAAQ